ncbi:MAG: 1-acyl-sn-glycerol-3-phosphate acyltransferase [Bacteroidales bacterium]|nr:1-acyl-sn-glycerol-3-phosphate acyltransferase [Bacteroidales bacterium]MCI2145115.1 1-acyl-sn-glycerol-3-phosphate acyltransferase [Bacteroidales bacterium]
MSTQIQDRDLRYDLLRCWADIFTLQSYRRHQYVNAADAPWNTGAIFASNHTNTLMDALVLTLANRSEKVFISRGDIFSKKKIADILHFLKIMPIFRIRDGLREVARDNGIISDAADILKGNTNLFLFPEGRHRPMHSLLPIGKGVGRIAFLASERFGGKKHIRVVPVGIEYEDYFRYRSDLCIEFGKPLDVTDFLAKNSGITAERQYALFRSMLSNAIRELITYIPDDGQYENIWEYVKICTTDSQGSPQMRKKDRRSVAAEMEKMRRDFPESFSGLMTKVEDFKNLRHKKRISVKSSSRRNTAARAALKWMSIALTAPYFVFSAIANFPTVIIVPILVKRLKDKAFSNTVRFGGGFLLSTPLFILWTVLLFVFTPWWVASIGAIMILFSRSFYYDWLEEARIAASDCRWLHDMELRNIYSEILKWK